jgi:hypothetical protein
MSNGKFTRDELVRLLQARPAPYITFTKVDGTERTMWCTLHESYIPEAAKPKNEKPVKENLDIIRVYDLENAGWRSFRVDSVTNWKRD